MLSSVSSRIVIHLTNAKDVKEKTNVMQAAAAIDGISKGAHRFLILESRLRPFGRPDVLPSLRLWLREPFGHT